MPNKLKKVLFIPDSHVPYEKTAAFNLLLKIGRQFKPDIVCILGDFADFYAVSAHDRDSDRREDLKWEVSVVRARLRQILALGAKRNIYVCGNHEYRLERYLGARAPKLFGFVSIPEVLQLGPQWEYVPYKSHTQIGKLYVTHDTGKAGWDAAKRSMEDFQDHTVIGHNHAILYCVKGNAKGVPHVAASFGWLGDAEAADYMHVVKAKRDWALGMGLGYLETCGNIHINPITFVPRGRMLTALVEGKLVEVRK